MAWCKKKKKINNYMSRNFKFLEKMPVKEENKGWEIYDGYQIWQLRKVEEWKQLIWECQPKRIIGNLEGKMEAKCDKINFIYLQPYNTESMFVYFLPYFL